MNGEDIQAALKVSSGRISALDAETMREWFTKSIDRRGSDEWLARGGDAMAECLGVELEEAPRTAGPFCWEEAHAGGSRARPVEARAASKHWAWWR
jgi:hypothetical protein